MNFERLRWLGTKLRRLFRRGREEAALDAELQFHLDQLAAEYRAEGMSEADARRAARREFGATDLYREEIRDTWRPPELADLWRSLRLAVRSLARTPGFASIAVLTIALGVGANTSLFTAINTVMLKPLAYPDGARLDRIHRTTPQQAEGGVSAADFFDLRREAERYGEVAAFSYGDASLAEPGHPAEIAPAIRVTSNFFAVHRMQPQIGREFRPEDESHGNDRIVILSQRYWRNRFGGRADIVGRTVRIDGVPHEIVGVMPAAFSDWRHLGWIDLYRPLGLTPEQTTDRRNTFLHLVGRRSATVSRAGADVFIADFGSRMATSFPEANAGSAWRRVALTDTFPGRNAPGLFVMLVGLAVSVLLIACSNLANLHLARTMTRAREFAVQGALGASRLQLLRPLVAETLLLAAIGGASSVVVAHWAGDWFSFRSTADNGEQVVFAVDWRVLGWALAASLVTAVAFGLAPALFAMRLDLNDTLKSGARGLTGGRGHQRFRHALIVGQFALALVLLAGAGLFIRGLDDLNSRRLGWDSDHLVSGTILLPAADYPDAERITAFHRLALERLRALPGVASASVSGRMPFFAWYESGRFLVEGAKPPEPGHEPAALVNGVSPGYFETVGTPLLAGRDFTERDTKVSPQVVIINQSMARGLFGSEDPIGRRLARLSGETVELAEVVGVAGDVESVLPQSAALSYQAYRPMAQDPRGKVEIAVRTTGVAPAAAVDAVRAVMTELDPDLPVRQLQPATTAIARANNGLSAVRDMLAAFAVLGLGLASLGLYGVIARTMAQRTGEFAIRLALGACIRDIMRLVLASGVKLALIGSALGLLGAFGVSRLLAAGLSGMRVDGLPVMAGAALLLLATALLACYVPARSASRITAMEALRLE